MNLEGGLQSELKAYVYLNHILSINHTLLKIQDYHGQESGNGWPIEDKEQNYELVGSSETNGVTVLKFKRKINTCDKEDREIPVCYFYAIYS